MSTKRSLTNSIVDIAIADREATKAKKSSSSDQSELKSSNQSNSIPSVTSPNVVAVTEDLKPRIKNSVSESREEATYPWPLPTLTPHPTTSSPLGLAINNDFIVTEVRNLTTEVDNDLAHMMADMNIEGSSTPVRSSTALTRDASHDETQNTIFTHSPVGQNFSSCYHYAGHSLHWAEGDLHDHYAAHDANYCSTSQQDSSDIPATQGIEWIADTCTDCQVILGPPKSCLHVSKYGHWWCCECFTLRNNSVPCKPQALIDLCRPCPWLWRWGWCCPCNFYCFRRCLVWQSQDPQARI
jgi:hypothetical protein